MAFDSVSTITLLVPTFTIRVNDWNLSVTLSKPTADIQLNSWVCNTVIPSVTLSALVNVPDSYRLAKTLTNPSFVITGSASKIFTLSKTLAKPALSFFSSVPNDYSASLLIPTPNFTSQVGITGSFVFNHSMRLPSVSLLASLGSTGIKQTWAFNTITTAHSRYTNWNFDSYFRIGTTNYGILNGDIYKLTGNYDYTGEVGQTNIDAYVTLPASTFGYQNTKSCVDAILYARADGEIEIQLILDEQERRDGFIISYDDRNGMHRKRVKIPKGLVGNVWQFIIKNVDGSNFDINAFEVYLRELSRITR